MHAKSKGFPLAQIEAAAEHYDDYHARLGKEADDAIACVRVGMRELDKLHGTQSFEKYMLAYSGQQWSHEDSPTFKAAY